MKFLLSLFIIFSNVLCSRKKIVFVVPEGTQSHAEFVLEILKELKEFDRTVITKEKNIKWVKSYEEINTIPIKAGDIFKEYLIDFLEKRNAHYSIKYIHFFFRDVAERFILPNYKDIVQKIKKDLEEIKPDLVICDFFSPSCLDVVRHYNYNYITTLQSLDALEPLVKQPYITNSMSFDELTTLKQSLFTRLKNILTESIKDYYYLAQIMNQLNEYRKEFGFETNNNFFGKKDGHILLFNSFFGFEVARYMSPNVKLIGPIIMEGKEDVPERLKEFIQKREKIILISNGSAFKRGEYENEQLYLSLKRLKELDLIDGVIWNLAGSKIHDDDFYFDDWIPQKTLLRHDNIKVFITHGGLGGIVESIKYKKPMLLIPFGADQIRNSKKVTELKIGYFVKRNSPKEIIYEKLLRILNTNLTVHLEKASIFTDQGIIGKLNAVQIIKDSIRLNELCGYDCSAEHLLSSDTKMNYFKSQNLDIYSIIFFGVLSIVVGMAYSTYLIYLKAISLMNGKIKTE